MERFKIGEIIRTINNKIPNVGKKTSNEILTKIESDIADYKNDYDKITFNYIKDISDRYLTNEEIKNIANERKDIFNKNFLNVLYENFGTNDPTKKNIIIVANNIPDKKTEINDLLELESAQIEKIINDILNVKNKLYKNDDEILFDNAKYNNDSALIETTIAKSKYIVSLLTNNKNKLKNIFNTLLNTPLNNIDDFIYFQKKHSRDIIHAKNLENFIVKIKQEIEKEEGQIIIDNKIFLKQFRKEYKILEKHNEDKSTLKFFKTCGEKKITIDNDMNRVLTGNNAEKKVSVIDLYLEYDSLINQYFNKQNTLFGFINNEGETDTLTYNTLYNINIINDVQAALKYIRETHSKLGMPHDKEPAGKTELTTYIVNKATSLIYTYDTKLNVIHKKLKTYAITNGEEFKFLHHAHIISNDISKLDKLIEKNEEDCKQQKLICDVCDIKKKIAEKYINEIAIMKKIKYEDAKNIFEINKSSFNDRNKILRQGIQHIQIGGDNLEYFNNIDKLINVNTENSNYNYVNYMHLNSRNIEILKYYDAKITYLLMSLNILIKQYLIFRHKFDSNNYDMWDTICTSTYDVEDIHTYVRIGMVDIRKIYTRIKNEIKKPKASINENFLLHSYCIKILEFIIETHKKYNISNRRICVNILLCSSVIKKCLRLLTNNESGSIKYF